MKISYLITCHNEVKTLDNLLSKLDHHINVNDEIIIIADDPTSETTQILSNWTAGQTKIFVYEHKLENDYGTHKNWGNKHCTGDFVFQIDADELPTENVVGDNLKTIIEANPSVELIYVPRINDFKGVNEEYANQWGWKLTDSQKNGIAQGRPIINWCDYQGRIYKNIPDRIKWDRKLHEKIEGHKEYSFLPAEEDYALYHDKTIEKQIETNLRYNKTFTEDENRGHKIT